ncbi:hypothetical protein PE067_02160 [Paracoccus sp. DMF-8]|uniref:anti-sigma factor family protein n=1 Tax=Paracoccus sp. DMF-8 TaxID=3019445 RepID=UPI0023E8E7E9|nr:hypothetical protein [Paracoccus sp. DMF-8]MDF3605069.1 hypothetical protein [Paracoccus sp. DMF-8]
MQIDDDILMALADGELAPDLADKVAHAVAGDPELQQRLERFTRTRDLLAGLAKAAPSPGIDPALVARIRAASAPAESAPTESTPAARIPTDSTPTDSAALQVAPDTTVTATPTPTPANLNRAPLAAIAAAFALAIVGFGWYGMNMDPTPAGPGATVSAALDSVSSGAGAQLDAGQELTIIASYRNGAGELCREYEIFGGDLIPELRVACHEGAAGWNTRFSLTTGAPGSAYQPASGEDEALDSFLSRSGAMAPMTLEEEAAALSALADGGGRG